jgi:hypothetical protein
MPTWILSTIKGLRSLPYLSSSNETLKTNIYRENIVMVQTPQLPLHAQRDSIALQAQSIPTNIHALQASTILPREKEL